MKNLSLIQTCLFVCGFATLAACGGGDTSIATDGGPNPDVTVPDTTTPPPDTAPACTDDDNDGYFVYSATCLTGNDCDDNNNTIHPGANDVCDDGIDQDCAGGDAVCPAGCEDVDNDGVLGYSPSCPEGKDCNDDNNSIYPGAAEICGDNIDQDCSEGDLPCCVDNDEDGYGDGSGCLGLDCNDQDGNIHPGADEICGNSKDDDCQGGDEACPPVECDYAATDLDEDGFGTGPGCDPVDCNDESDAVFPGADEVCGDGIDNDCLDGDLVCPTTDCVDNDGDLYGEGSDCLGPDCNDSDLNVNPAATEDPCGDGIDQDCTDGDPDCPSACVDVDEDGAYAIAADCPEGTDCNDGNADIKPGVEDICGNGIDEDCAGGDLICPPIVGCNTDGDCTSGEICNTATNECEVEKLWHHWAPVVYGDTHEDNVGWDSFTSVDFDGDNVAGNNGNNLGNYAKTAKVYYSYVKTATHAYIGYHFYYPMRWSTWGSTFGTQYENQIQSVLMVIRTSPGTYGNLVLMETTGENAIYRYVPENSDLLPNDWLFVSSWIDGSIQFDTSSGHPRPIVFIDDQTHDISGDEDWVTNGFPGDNGYIYDFGWTGDVTNGVVGNATYELVEMKSTLWAQSAEIGDTKMFESFGTFAGDDASSMSRAPWALYSARSYWDGTPEAVRPWGELLYDPATLVRAHFPEGWGTFDYMYEYNPYALRVDVNELGVYATKDLGFGESQNADVYLNVLLRDGGNNERLVLGRTTGYQNSWYVENVPVETVFNMFTELGRYWFYGMAVPGEAFAGFEVFDYDAASGDDWMMASGETYYADEAGSWLVSFAPPGEQADSIIVFTITPPN